MQALQFYQQFITNPTLLATGHTLIRNFLLQSPQNRSDTLIQILTPSPPVLTLIGNVYPREVYPTLSAEEKGQTRVYLLEVLYRCVKEEKEGAKSRNCQALMALLAKIHSQEGYDMWIQLYVQLIKNIPQQHFGYFIITLLKSADSRITPLSTNIFSHLMQELSQSLNSTESIRPPPIPSHPLLNAQQLLQIFYYSTKSFSHLYATDPNTISPHFDPYKKQLMDFIWASLQNNPVCMKYGIKLLTVLYGEMEIYEIDKGNLGRLLDCGSRLLEMYLQEGGDQAEIEQEEEDELETEEYTPEQLSSPQLISQYLPIILYQLLQLLTKICQQQQCSPQSHTTQLLSKILMFTILVATPSKKQFHFYNKHSSIYLSSIEDQFVRVIRNRANSLLVNLVEEGEDDVRDELCRLLREYFEVVGAAVQNGNGTLAQLEGFLNGKRFCTWQFKLHGQFQQYQQGCYFLLASILPTLYSNKNQRKQIVKYLLQQSKQTPHTIIKIIAIYICIQELKHPYDKDIVQFLMEGVRGYKTQGDIKGLVNGDGGIGLGLVLARGLGKLLCTQKLLVPQHIPIHYLQSLATHTLHTTTPTQDSTHIILQLLLKLTEQSPENKQNLSQHVITSSILLHLLTNCSHDGLLSSLSLRLLELYPYPDVVQFVVQGLLGGGVVEERVGEIVAKWMQDGVWVMSAQDFASLVSRYNGNKGSIITNIVKVYLAQSQSNQIPHALIELMNTHPDQTWLIPMLKSSILLKPQSVLLQNLHNLAYEYTSQYQIQNKLILPFYTGIYQTQKFLQVIRMQNALFQSFTQKLIKYSKLFQGKCLKMVAAVFWIRIAETCGDLKVVSQVVQLVEGFGKLEVDQWEEEGLEGEDDDMDDHDNSKAVEDKIFNKLMNFQLENQIVEKQLEELFKQDIWNWNTQYFDKKVLELKQKIGK